ncbi:Na/Pi cotransporter family protein [Butyricicoccus intestinisimiae]|jgi:phosphate:Na+ symporter|uniref:Na/Pi cotransporter family protein n=1 Tax=Butyricicoccus intestinisimiae TaxID=2841509 RepID=UPI003D8E31C0
MNEIMTTVFGLAGGLAMFLFGMNSMSDALQKAAGERMKQILSFLTKNPIMGALAGALVTAVLQSSSATTVMVIGFVSAGLMTLPQGISVIFGANIGTTMTAQLMAFKISDYIYPIIFIGFLVYFIAKSEKAKNIGMVIFSFGLLFEGIEIMGSVMKPLAGSAVFTDLMGRVSEIPALGVLLGAAMTLVVQSSSATIAVLQNFASQPAADGVTSVIGLAGAIPILLGDNIGTTITALLASIGQSKAAKRTAISHSIFNITGSIVFACLIRPFAAFVTYISPSGNEVDVIARQIANAHTCFNIVCTLIWLPLLPVMVKLVTTIIPGKDKLPQTDCKPKFLDEKLLEQPVAAMYLLSQEIGRCADMASDMLNTAKAALRGKAEDFHTYEVESNQVRNLRNDINDYTAKLLSSGVLTESQSEQTAGLLYVSNNIDRMTEYSQRVTQTVQQVYQSGRKLSASAEQELKECYDTAHDLFDRAVDSVRYGDADMAQQVLTDKKKLRKAQKRFNKAHMARVKAGKCEANLTADFSAILYGLERMVDNSVNIAEETIDSIHFVELEPAQMEALSDRGIPVPVPAQ